MKETEKEREEPQRAQRLLEVGTRDLNVDNVGKHNRVCFLCSMWRAARKGWGRGRGQLMACLRRMSKIDLKCS